MYEKNHLGNNCSAPHCGEGGVTSQQSSAVHRPSSTAHIKIPGKPKAITESIAEVSTNPDKPIIAANDNNETQKLLPVMQIQSIPAIAPQSGVPERPLPYKLDRFLLMIKDSSGNAYVTPKGCCNPLGHKLGSKRSNALILECARQEGIQLRQRELVEVNHLLEAYAEQYAETTDVWYRVAKIEGGVELDVGDEAQTRIRITPGKVEIITAGSPVVFVRGSNTLPLVMPAEEGDLSLLKKYLNVAPTEQLLLKAWITYLIAHPKGQGTKYVFLVIQSGEGCGKSILAGFLLSILDPSSIGVQSFPANAKDLAIAGLHAHVLAFDNLRSFKDHMADTLCIASTGGSIASRKLYSDADQQAIRLHVAVILNGIHNFIDQPDLRQRILQVHPRPIGPSQRKSEEQLREELAIDQPYIMRGLYDLTAKVLEQLPHAELQNPERMIEFSQWLAALEKVDEAPTGVYQGLYSDVLRQGQLDTLMDNPLAAAIIQFADGQHEWPWSGTPTDLHNTLNRIVGVNTQRSREWPQNPIALSKRIAPLQAGLQSQGIRIELSRGKERTVTITKIGG